MRDIESAVREHLPQIAAAASLVIAAAKYGPPAWKVVLQMIRLARALEAIAALPHRMDLLSAQFERNGGTSFRDAIDRQSAAIKSLTSDVQTLGLKVQTRWTMSFGMPSWESDSFGRCVKANSELCCLLDVDEHDILGANWKNSIHPEDQAKVAARWAEAVREGSDFNMVTRYISSSGRCIPVRLRAHVMILNGNTVGWIGTAETLGD